MPALTINSLVLILKSLSSLMVDQFMLTLSTNCLKTFTSKKEISAPSRVVKGLLKSSLILTLVCAIPTVKASEQDEYLGILSVLENTQKISVRKHQHFHNQTKQLQTKIATLCQKTDPQNLVQAQQSWHDAMNAWMEVSVLQFGPVMDNDLRLRVQAWPIRPKLLARAIKPILKKPKPVTVQQIENSSVALQGLPAIEYLLFKQNATELIKASGGCSSLKAISEHTATLAQRLSRAWQKDFPEVFSSRTVLKDKELALAQLDDYMNGLATSLQQIKRRKLEEPLGLLGGKGKKALLESHLSKASLNNIRSNIQSIHQLLEGGDTYGVIDFLRQFKGDGVALLLLEDQLNLVKTTLKSMNFNLEDAYANPAQMKQVENLFEQTGKLLSVMEKSVFKELGVTRDFNSEDGD